jgi:UDP-perosamine 4-acetyltransferase
MSTVIISTPLLNNNEEMVRVVAWLAELGSVVVAGQSLVTLETTKVASDVEIQESGFLRWRGGEVGDMVAVNSPLAIITMTPHEPFEIPQERFLESEQKIKDTPKASESLKSFTYNAIKEGFWQVPVSGNPKFRHINATLKAKVLLNYLGIDPVEIDIKGRITLGDIKKMLDISSEPIKKSLKSSTQRLDLASLGEKSLATVIIGDGPHARYVLDTARRSGVCNVVGFTSLTKSPGELIDGLPVLGRDDDLPEILASGVRLALVGIGSERAGMRSNERRADIFRDLKGLGFSLPVLVDPDSSVSSSAEIGEGTLIAAGAVVSANVRIGRNCLINIGSIVCHDAVVGDHVHLTPGSILAGSTCVGELTTIGMGATLLDGTSVGRKCLVLNNTRIINDLPEGVIAGVQE